MKRFSNFLFLFALTFIIGLTSCNRDNIDEVTVQDPYTPVETESNPLISQIRTNDGLDLGCFILQTPFDVLLENGETSTIESEEDLTELLESGELIVDFVYPLTVINNDEEEIAVADAMALGELFASCIPEDGYGEGFPAFLINYETSCFTLKYPVTIEDEESNVSTAADELEFIELISENPYQFFQFPITLIDEDGEEHVANDEDELFVLLVSCEDEVPCDSVYYNGYIACYTIVFPIDLLDINGEVITANNEDEFIAVIIGGEAIGFSYPITLADEDGNEVVINSEEELAIAIEECGFSGGPIDSTGLDVITLFAFSMNGCYAINYPVSVNLIDGTTIQINSDMEFQELFDMLDPANPTIDGLVYPVSVVETESGNTITIESEETLFEYVFDACN